jgi:hypothetical protein
MTAIHEIDNLNKYIFQRISLLNQVEEWNIGIMEQISYFVSKSIPSFQYSILLTQKNLLFDRYHHPQEKQHQQHQQPAPAKSIDILPRRLQYFPLGSW